MLRMNEIEYVLLRKLLAVRGLDDSAIETLPRFFTTLTVDEKAEVFLAKKGLYKPLHRQAKSVSKETSPPPSEIIDFASFIIAIDMAKRPSHYHYRKVEIDSIPDFASAFIDGQRRPRKRDQKRIIKMHFMGHIKKWKSDGMGLRTIAKAISKSPIGITISHTALDRIYKEICQEKEENNSHEHE